MEHTIKYYPVGNADCTLIKLDKGKTIIVDCQILADLTDYDDDDNKDEIIIEELWITPRGLKDNMADTAVEARKEAS